MSRGRGRPSSALRRVTRRLRRAVVSKAYAEGWLPDRFWPDGDLDAPEKSHPRADADAEAAELLSKLGADRVGWRSVGDARREVFPPGRDDDKAWPIGSEREPLTDSGKWAELVALLKLLRDRDRS